MFRQKRSGPVDLDKQQRIYLGTAERPGEAYRSLLLRVSFGSFRIPFDLAFLFGGFGIGPVVRRSVTASSNDSGSSDIRLATLSRARTCADY